MKATILTFSKALNRGSNMQCYAMAKTLEKKGYEVEFLDIQMPQKKLSLKGCLYVKANEWKIDPFRRQQGFRFTKKYNTYEELVNDPPKTDVLVMGSDQIWNNSYTMRFDPRIYYGGFIHGIKKISYAASFGLDTWHSTPYDEEIKEAVREMEAISVREDSGVNICKEVFGREDAVCVVDPTLLLKKEYLKELIDRKTKAETKGSTYVYLLHKDKQINDVTKALIAELGCPAFGFQQKSGLASLLATTSVPEWLANINEAEHIVTNSFHCMVMCILLQKDFYVVPTFPGREIRMTSLMEKLSINNRYISYANDIRTCAAIDYKQVAEKLDVLRSEALSFINQHL